MNVNNSTRSPTVLAPVIEVDGLTKRFGDHLAVSQGSFRLEPGDFVGLMGPNGAGKSTLIKMLSGVYTATSGEIRVDGRRIPSLAKDPRIGFIHQDLGLIDDLSISDNLRLKQPPIRAAGPFLSIARERASAASTLEAVGIELDPSTLVGDISTGEKALIAIARAFARGASVIFMDEATSTLPVDDARMVIDTLRSFAARGAIVVMVSHKLSEILDACRRVIVLLDGKIAVDRSMEGLDRAALVDLLVQHDSLLADQGGRPEPGAAVLRLDRAESEHIGPIDLTVRSGEVVGISGPLGSGLHDIGFMAHGILRPQRGQVILSPHSARRSIVPPHRESQGGFADMTVSENMTIASLRRWRNSARLLSRRREHQDTTLAAHDLNVQPPDVTAAYDTLSGGNKQKVIFGRAVLNEPALYVLCEPTRGVDVGTRAEIYRIIRELRDQGSAILVISSDPEDLLSVCDMIAVVTEGRLGELKSTEAMTSAELELVV